MIDELMKHVTVWRCCRDWPMVPAIRVGRCGYCGERPVYTDKTIEQYMAEREAK